jgi:LacI family transcriptional regulator
MKDVAREAGVNQSTVSRVLGAAGGASISADVRRRILRIARALDFHPNPTAVALRTGATRTVMVVVSDMTDMYYSGIISGVQEVLVAEGYSLVLHSLAHAGPLEDLPRLVRRYHFDGVLMLGALPGMSDAFIASLAGRELPIVLVGRALKAYRMPAVTAANSDGGRLAAAHLWGLGHRRIAVMRGPRGWPDITKRITGFRAELKRHVARAETLRLFPCNSREMKSGYESTLKLLESWKPSAIFCMNDATALGTLSALRGAGLRVPDDVSVIGFDDGEIAEFACPPLTSIRQPRLRMGREGALRLMLAMRGEEAESLVVGVELIVRESTCRAS